MESAAIFDRLIYWLRERFTVSSATKTDYE
jgi:hypothetical protein